MSEQYDSYMHRVKGDFTIPDLRPGFAGLVHYFARLEVAQSHPELGENLMQLDYFNVYQNVVKSTSGQQAGEILSLAELLNQEGRYPLERAVEQGNSFPSVITVPESYRANLRVRVLTNFSHFWESNLCLGQSDTDQLIYQKLAVHIDDIFGKVDYEHVDLTEPDSVKSK